MRKPFFIPKPFFSQKKVIFAAAGFLFTVPVFAATLPQPKAAYDATVTIEYGTSQTISTVNADGPKERRTAALIAGGQPQTIIIRRDQNKIYLLIPALNAVLPLGNGDIPGFNLGDLNTLPVEAEGGDTIDGLEATRYRATAASGQGRFDGLIWMTPDGIPLQISGTVTEKNGKTTPVKITTSSLHVRPQEERQFEIPPGMKMMPAGMAKLLNGTKTAPAP